MADGGASDRDRRESGAAEELPAAAFPRQPVRTPVDVAGRRVLVVDGNAVNRAMISEQMAAWRFDAATCASGEEALSLVEAAMAAGIGIDLAILDCQMPGMNGVELARLLRASPHCADTPIIMLGSVDPMEDSRALSALGIDAHLSWPAHSSLLLETMLAVLSARSRDEDFAPAIVPESDEPDGAGAPAPLPAGPRVDVLVAEGNEVNQIVFTQILRMTRYSFRIAGDGVEAVRLFRQLRPRMILMDVSMPRMNGLEAAAEIRAIEKTENMERTPIVAVTAHAIKGDIERCLDAGMDDYLSKPVSPDLLTDMVARWMDAVDAGALHRA